jgi:hypothetical protein
VTDADVQSGIDRQRQRQQREHGEENEISDCGRRESSPATDQQNEADKRCGQHHRRPLQQHRYRIIRRYLS